MLKETNRFLRGKNMKYWQVTSDNVTNFTIIECDEKPDVREITKTEYNNYKNWLKEHS